jgi:hypothetical protein
MKKLLVLAAILSVSAAYAGDLVNKDSKQYRIEVKKDSSTRTEFSISGSTTQCDSVKKGYVLRNATTGDSITVSTDKKVYIKNGKFSQD